MEPNETPEVATEETSEAVETTEDESTEESKVEKPKRTPEEELTYFRGRVKRLEKDLGVAVESTKEASKPKTGELDDTALDYLDLKGVTESEDIKVVEDIVKKTGMSVREAIKDDYVQAKLKVNKDKRDVQAATPSSTKRGSPSVTDSEDYWYAKYESEGKLPEGMPKGMAEKVVNRRMSSSDPRKNPYE